MTSGQDAVQGLTILGSALVLVVASLLVIKKPKLPLNFKLWFGLFFVEFFMVARYKLALSRMYGSTLLLTLLLLAVTISLVLSKTLVFSKTKPMKGPILFIVLFTLKFIIDILDREGGVSLSYEQGVIINLILYDLLLIVITLELLLMPGVASVKPEPVPSAPKPEPKVETKPEPKPKSKVEDRAKQKELRKCPHCGGKLSELYFYKLKAGEHVTCEFCNEII